MKAAFIVGALRTPIGKHRGALARNRPDDLAAHVVASLLESLPEGLTPDEVIFGATNQAGEDNRDVARMAALLAGLPFQVPGVTVNRLCGSGLEALVQARRAIAVGDADCVIAGGVESMSRAPYAMTKPEEAFPRKPPQIFDTSLGWRFPNPRMAERFPMHSMGETAENVAEEYKVSREDQDAFAVGSHQKAARAWDAGEFAAEVRPVVAPPASRKSSPVSVERDESVRPDSSLEALARLKPVFRDGGSVTAGNSSPLNDGAAGLLVVSERFVEDHGLVPMARVVASAVAGVHPNLMGTGPISATRKLFAKTGIKPGDLDVVELNEAFASQSLACIRELNLDPDRVNVRGGAIALGHPIGCSGARIAVTLAHAMKSRGAKRGLATLCIGVGQGLSVLLERP